MPSVKNMQPSGNISLVMTFLKISKYFILSALIIALARPRTYTISQDRDESKGIDIMLSVDVSLSMMAKDLDPDRLTALKKLQLISLIKEKMTGLVWWLIPEKLIPKFL